MITYHIYYAYTDTYTSENDFEGMSKIQAKSEAQAIAKFHEGCPGDQYTVQCVVEERKTHHFAHIADFYYNWGGTSKFSEWCTYTTISDRPILQRAS